MRPPIRFALLAALSRRPRREIERPERIATVRASEAWTDVQVEAWLDWAEAEGFDTDAEDPLADAAALFAARLGLPDRAFHRDHYDLPDAWWKRAVDAGAVPVSSRVLVRRLRDSGLRVRADRALAR